MKPYYDEGGITIYHGDCREVDLPRVDAVITDPPYGDTSLDWDTQVKGWMDVALGCTSNLWCFGSFRMFIELSRLEEFSQWKIAQEIVWEKHNGSSFHADRFKRVHELAVQLYVGKWGLIYKCPVKERAIEAKRVIRAKRPTHTGHIGKSAYSRERGGEVFMRSVIYARSCHGAAQHPTQKPIEIIDPLLRYSVPDKGSVADLFVGSGSTLVAAKALGLCAIGVEIEERYCEIAAKRLSQDVLDLRGSGAELKKSYYDQACLNARAKEQELEQVGLFDAELPTCPRCGHIECEGACNPRDPLPQEREHGPEGVGD